MFKWWGHTRGKIQIFGCGKWAGVTCAVFARGKKGETRIQIKKALKLLGQIQIFPFSIFNLKRRGRNELHVCGKNYYLTVSIALEAQAPFANARMCCLVVFFPAGGDQEHWLAAMSGETQPVQQSRVHLSRLPDQSSGPVWRPCSRGTAPNRCTLNLTLINAAPATEKERCRHSL